MSFYRLISPPQRNRRSFFPLYRPNHWHSISLHQGSYICTSWLSLLSPMSVISRSSQLGFEPCRCFISSHWACYARAGAIFYNVNEQSSILLGYTFHPSNNWSESRLLCAGTYAEGITPRLRQHSFYREAVAKGDHRRTDDTITTWGSRCSYWDGTV